jgi:hypothetical protein
MDGEQTGDQEYDAREMVMGLANRNHRCLRKRNLVGDRIDR